MTKWTNYLCDNTTDLSGRPCRLCRATDELVVSINIAIARYLEDRFPVRSALDASPHTEIFDAVAYLAQGLLRLIETAAGGRRVFMCHSPGVDPFDGTWHTELGWDYAEDRTRTMLRDAHTRVWGSDRWRPGSGHRRGGSPQNRT